MAIDSRAIIEAVGTLPLVGNEEGLIPGFGLYLTRHYADYYNRISFAYLHAKQREGEDAANAAVRDLVEAGHICGFNTFGGIMISQEWDAVVQPMIEGRPDWVRGMVSIVNALGWGVWEIDSLKAGEDTESGEELIVSCANSYESEGYLRDYPKRDAGGACFLATGGVCSIMNLLYHGDITSKPSGTEDFYKQIFHEGDNRFVAHETDCRAHGAERCTWVARRAQAW
jgi:hypothetical protein